MTQKEKINTLVAYCKLKLDEGDYHAVADCANDLRVLEAQYCHVCDNHKNVLDPHIKSVFSSPLPILHGEL